MEKFQLVMMPHKVLRDPVWDLVLLVVLVAVVVVIESSDVHKVLFYICAHLKHCMFSVTIIIKHYTGQRKTLLGLLYRTLVPPVLL